MADNPIERGNQAAALLENRFLKECLEHLEKEYIAHWRNAVTVEARENAHKFVTLIDKLRQDLRSVATTGEIARERYKDLTGKSRKWNVF